MTIVSRSHRSWAPELQRDNPPVFSSCYSYSSGIALVWDGEEPALSAVILLEYTEGPGNGRFYNEFDVMDGYYLPSATSTKFEHVLRTLLDAKCGLNSAMIKFVVNNGSISLLEQALIQAQDGIFWDDLTRMAYIEKWARRHTQRHHNDGEQEHSVERISSTDNMTGNSRIIPEGSHTYASNQTSAAQNVMGQRLKTQFGWENSHVSAPAYATTLQRKSLISSSTDCSWRGRR
ncbi:hypothetical protein VE03_10743 [Pseudogymnoascus sp. 23342-1-I1]|nr:hypothetical protein VE03_10743 [Pseudogymnoascus sp. 23342-1-I1]